MMHQILTNSLAAKINLFELTSFDQFADSETGIEISKQLMNEHAFYKDNIQKQLDALPACLSHDQKLVMQIYEGVSNDNGNIELLSQKLRTVMASMISSLPSACKIAGSHHTKILEYVCRSHLSVESDLAFPFFKNDGTSFDWNMIETAVSQQKYIDKVLKDASLMYLQSNPTTNSQTQRSQPYMRVVQLKNTFENYDPSIA